MLRIQLGDLEKQVLEFLWEKKRASLKEISDVFREKKGLAYTTVATVLQRLCNKGLLVRKEGVYSPAVSKRDFSVKFLKEFLNNFLNSFGEVAYSSFVEGIESLDEKKRKRLLEKLEGFIKNEG